MDRLPNGLQEVTGSTPVRATKSQQSRVRAGSKRLLAWPLAGHLPSVARVAELSLGSSWSTMWVAFVSSDTDAETVRVQGP